MTYKIGTRVKKVRGDMNVGATGVVTTLDTCSPGVQRAVQAVRRLLGDGKWQKHFGDLFVRMDNAWQSPTGHQPAGKTSIGYSDQWEPIIPDGHQPCEDGFSLDDLLNREEENRVPAQATPSQEPA